MSLAQRSTYLVGYHCDGSPYKRDFSAPGGEYIMADELEYMEDLMYNYVRSPEAERDHSIVNLDGLQVVTTLSYKPRKCPYVYTPNTSPRLV